jgi:hypothetical protein
MMRFIISLLTVISILPFIGCEQIQNQPSDAYSGKFQRTCLFSPEKIQFNQLTESTKPGQITAYIDVFDQFGSRIKAAGVWRFELFGYVPRSADPMGSRVNLWSDIELTDPVINNNAWQEYLHCYKFDLDIDTDLAGKTYILQAVCFTADGRRLSDTFELKH